jgi:hypothetical protein
MERCDSIPDPADDAFIDFDALIFRTRCLKNLERISKFLPCQYYNELGSA